MDGFITLEGCEGVGKTVQTRLLKEYCEKNNLDIVFTREPGGSRVAEKIRKIILDADNMEMCDMCEAFLYAASRVQHLNEIVIPALANKKTVICDRFVHSSYAYQGIARGIGLEKVKQLNALAVGEYMPQYTVFLDLDPKRAFERKGGADKADRLEVQSVEFHQKVYSGYLSLIEQQPEKFIVIDASGSEQQVHNLLLEELRKKNVLR